MDDAYMRKDLRREAREAWACVDERDTKEKIWRKLLISQLHNCAVKYLITKFHNRTEHSTEILKLFDWLQL